MPRATWPLVRGKPRIEVVLTQAIDGRQAARNLLADTGAGSDRAAFELILDENDCLNCGGQLTGMVQLSGAFSGSFPVYRIRILIPQLGFRQRLRVVGVSNMPTDFDGIAGFRFLNRFGYGNFRDPGQFGIET